VDDARVSRITAHVRAHILLWLTLGLIPAVAGTAALSRAFHDRQHALADHWRQAGREALAADRAAEAVEAFRNALSFAREDRGATLELARALAAAGRVPEARTYLLGLLENQPGHGAVNLELARVEAARHDLTSALRYYHRAIDGSWPGGGEAERVAARLELATFLIEERAAAQAQSELVAFAGDLPPDRAVRLRVAALMRDAGLPGRALEVYTALLGEHPADATALEGAALAAFAGGTYRQAVNFFRRAARQRPLAAASSRQLEIAQLVLALDPLQPRLSAAERRRRAARAFEAAVARLDGCAAAQSAAGPFLPLMADVAPLRRGVSPRAFARDPELMDRALSITWRVAIDTADACGVPQGIDAALLLLARRHGGEAP
jgi:Flp pilus assembly protein TadD